MFRYYLRLAAKSQRSTPAVTGLMIGTIGLGIAVFMAALTVFYLMSANPVAHKNDVLHAVTLDAWDPDEGAPVAGGDHAGGALPPAIAEREHGYGPRVRLLSNPLIDTLVARLCAPGTPLREITSGVRCVYESLVTEASRHTGDSVDYVLDAYSRIDLSMNWRSSNSLTFRAVVENLLDESYQQAVGFPAPGRFIRLGVEWRPGNCATSC